MGDLSGLKFKAELFHSCPQRERPENSVFILLSGTIEMLTVRFRYYYLAVANPLETQPQNRLLYLIDKRSDSDA
jgi:hypothetical protein